MLQRLSLIFFGLLIGAAAGAQEPMGGALSPAGTQETVNDSHESAGSAQESRAPRWRLELSPHTEHYRRSEDHRRVWLVGIERESADGSLMGAGVFQNSFGQTSVYFYPWGGVHRNLLNVEPLFFKWALGVIYGYRPPYQDRLPLTIQGYSPVIIPAVGWEFGRGVSAQLNLLGTAAVMFQFSLELR